MTTKSKQTLWSNLTKQVGINKINESRIVTGVIAPPGQQYLHHILKNTWSVELPENWQWEWTVSKSPAGLPAGTFARRLSNFLYKEHGITISSTQLSIIGSNVGMHVESPGNELMFFDIDETLTWEPGCFSDNGSCMAYNWVFESVQNAEGFALRSFRPTEDRMLVEEPEGNELMEMERNLWYGTPGKKSQWYNGHGRCWLFPMTTVDTLVILNSYGNNLYTFARLLSNLLNVSYKKVDLANEGEANNEDGIYINSDKGILIGTSEFLANIDEWDIATERAYIDPPDYDDYDEDY